MQSGMQNVTIAQAATLMTPFGPALKQIRLDRFKDLDDAAFKAFIDTVKPTGANINQVNISNSAITKATMLDVLKTPPVYVYGLYFSGNSLFTSPTTAEIAALPADLSSLNGIGVGWGGVTDLAFLKELYDNHMAFRAGADIDVSGLNLDLRPGTANRAVIDFFADPAKGLSYFAWQDGNITQ